MPKLSLCFLVQTGGTYRTPAPSQVCTFWSLCQPHSRIHKNSLDTPGERRRFAADSVAEFSSGKARRNDLGAAPQRKSERPGRT